MAGSALVSVTLFLLALVTGTNVLAQTPAASTGCISSVASLAPCTGFLTGGYSSAAPGCCSAFAQVAVGSAPCLCQFLGMNNSLGFSFNQTRTLLLSGLCKVNTPPLSQCTTAGSPLAPPLASPPASSPTAVLPSPAPSTTGPSTTGNGNGGAMTNVRSRAASFFAPSGIGLVGGLLSAYICM